MVRLINLKNAIYVNMMIWVIYIALMLITIMLISQKKFYYEKFRVIHREAEYFETDCIVDIETYKKINSADEQSYLVCNLYLEKYYDWLNELYDFKKDLAFQELIDYVDVEHIINSTVSKKLYRDFKKYHDEAILYSKQLGKKNSFIEMYESMMKAFKFASKNGKVMFI